MNCRSTDCNNNKDGFCAVTPRIGEKGLCGNYAPVATWFLTDKKLCQCCHAVNDHTYICVQICGLDDGRYGISAVTTSFWESLDGDATVQPDFVRPTDYVFKGKVFLELASVIASMRNRDYWEKGLLDERFDTFNAAKDYLRRIVDCALPDGDGPDYIQIL